MAKRWKSRKLLRFARPLTRSTSRNGTTQNDTFGYNSRSELTSAVSDVDANYNYAYAFDNIGNRSSSTEASSSKTYVTNNCNQYQAITEVIGEQTSFFPPDFDADGNAVLVYTKTGVWVVTYNGANRPIRFRNDSTDTTVDCGYDSQGRRYFKKVTVAGTVTLHHRYIYRGYLQIACVDCTRSGHPALWLVTWDPSQPTATRPLALQKDGNWFTYGYDITKNICEVFGQHGYIRTAYSYAPFGAVTESGDVTQPFQWSSEHYDSELDLVYYNYRHYSPTLGRWLSRDPIAEQGGRNLYAFVKNAPILMSDVKGKDFCSFLEWAKSEALEKLDEKIKNLGEKLSGKIEKEIKRNIDREYRKAVEKYAPPLEDYSSLTLFPTIDSTSPTSEGLRVSFSAYLTSSSLVNVNGRNYAIKGSVEYTIDSEGENFEQSVRITDDVGMCGICINIDYQLSKNWNFDISLGHEHSYERGFSETENASVNFNFKYTTK